MIAAVLPLINSHLWRTGAWYGYVASTVAGTVVGDILPQTIVSLFTMEVAVNMTWFAKILMGLMAIPALPFTGLLHLARRWRKKSNPYKMDGLLEIDELIEFIRIHEEGAELGGNLENGTGKMLRMMMKQHGDLQHWKMVVVVHSGPQSSFTIFQQRIDAEAESSDVSSLTTESNGGSRQETIRGLRRRTNQSSEAHPPTSSEKVNPALGSYSVRTGSTTVNIANQPEAWPLGSLSRNRSSATSSPQRHSLRFNQVDGPNISEVDRLSLRRFIDEFLQLKDKSTSGQEAQPIVRSISTPIAGQATMPPLPRSSRVSNGENIRNGFRSASTGMIPDPSNRSHRTEASFWTSGHMPQPRLSVHSYFEERDKGSKGLKKTN